MAFSSVSLLHASNSWSHFLADDKRSHFLTLEFQKGIVSIGEIFCISEQMEEEQ